MKMDFPRVQYYDQSFVDVYNRSWAWLRSGYWHADFGDKGGRRTIFSHPESSSLSLFEACMSTFFLSYSNRQYSATVQMDNLYSRQEANGAIRSHYELGSGQAIASPDNPEGLSPPLLGWIEYNLYHKIGGKKRVMEVLPVLERHFDWVENTFFDKEVGLLACPLAASQMGNSPRGEARYLVDINAQQALNALYIARLGDIVNNKDLSFRFKKHYFSYKSRINALMWNAEDKFYYDLDPKGEQNRVATLASYWPLLAELANEDRAEQMWRKLLDPEWFGSENPFPSLAIRDQHFSRSGCGYRGSVYPHLTFMVIKALERYERYAFARECAIRHIYHILDTYHGQSGKEKAELWEAYAPFEGLPAQCDGRYEHNRACFLPFAALSSIVLMLENIIGLSISLPHKTVVWMVPTLEAMGVENLFLKRNIISVLSNRSGRGWEIRLDSEKLYYFTIDLIGHKRKTLPIPSGRCSMLVDKL